MAAKQKLQLYPRTSFKIPRLDEQAFPPSEEHIFDVACAGYTYLEYSAGSDDSTLPQKEKNVKRKDRCISDETSKQKTKRRLISLFDKRRKKRAEQVAQERNTFGSTDTSSAQPPTPSPPLTSRRRDYCTCYYPRFLGYLRVRLLKKNAPSSVCIFFSTCRFTPAMISFALWALRWPKKAKMLFITILQFRRAMTPIFITRNSMILEQLQLMLRCVFMTRFLLILPHFFTL